jgi:hypothetical protein
MKYVHLTWYLLVDGTHADPNEVAPDKDGVLRHKNGLAVALREDGVPMSVGRGAVENKNVEAAQAGDDTVAEAAQIAADDKPDPVANRVTKPIKKLKTR